MESFSALLQKNVLNTRRWTTRQQLRLAIVTWIEASYHRGRRQRRPGRLTPIELEATYLAAHGLNQLTPSASLTCSSPLLLPKAARKRDDRLGEQRADDLEPQGGSLMAVQALHRRQAVVLLSVVLLVLGLLRSAPDASAATSGKAGTGWCWYRGSFGGKHYCPATMEGIMSTKYGVGRRVFLYSVIIEDVEDHDVLVTQQRGPVCDEGTCDFYTVGETIPWSGTHRPATGALVELFGTTTKGSLVPDGYVFGGTCEDPYRVPC